MVFILSTILLVLLWLVVLPLGRINICPRTLIPPFDANIAACIGSSRHLSPSWMCIGILPFKPRLIWSKSLPNLLESCGPYCALEGCASPNKFIIAIQVNNYLVGNKDIRIWDQMTCLLQSSCRWCSHRGLLFLGLQWAILVYQELSHSHLLKSNPLPLS
jgi:hypothetical protein